MFFVFMVLFLAGLYLFGVGITIESAWVFIAGLVAVCVSVGMLFHLPSDTKRTHT